MNKSVIIIGGGLGALECAFVLLKQGWKVTILEQSAQVGGCLQTFRRGNTYFDTGFHCVGGINEGEPLYNYFQYLNLLDLPWLPIQGEEVGLKIHHTTDAPSIMLEHIKRTYQDGSWRLRGGGKTFINHLVADVQTMGGIIRTKAKVTSIIEGNKCVKAVVVNHTEELQADYYICDIHPMALFALLPQDTAIRKIYRKRISRLPNSFGMFTANICLHPNTIPYQDRNIIIKTDGTDMCNLRPHTTQVITIHFYPDQSAIDILTPMFWEEVQQWENTTVGRRGDEYKAFKQQKLEECLRLAECALPNIRESIDKVFTSTPLTWRDYIGTYQGSAYGILKDGTVETTISKRTNLSNLFLTGQNVNFHGILGVTITAFETCEELLGYDVLN